MAKKQVNSLKIEIDPHNRFTHLPDDYIVQSLGYIPQFANNPLYADKSLKETLDKSYGFGLFEMHDGIITDTGIFKFPGDPDLYPLAKMTRNNEHLYQYPHAIIAIWCADIKSYFVTRMD